MLRILFAGSISSAEERKCFAAGEMCCQPWLSGKSTGRFAEVIMAFV